jgi:hypothetical protein
VSTAYAIVQVYEYDSGPRIRVTRVVWREQEAVEEVERLNALGSGTGRMPYSWQTTWVNPPLDPREATALTRTIARSSSSLALLGLSIPSARRESS